MVSDGLYFLFYLFLHFLIILFYNNLYIIFFLFQLFYLFLYFMVLFFKILLWNLLIFLFSPNYLTFNFNFNFYYNKTKILLILNFVKFSISQIFYLLICTLIFIIFHSDIFSNLFIKSHLYKLAWGVYVYTIFFFIFTLISKNLSNFLQFSYFFVLV